MITGSDGQQGIRIEPHLAELNSQPVNSAAIMPDHSSQLLPRSKFIAHHPKAGVNPLVDAAASLFSVIGKLKQFKSYRNLTKLHLELVDEVNTFQDAAKARGYSSEYVLVSRYAVCATLDDAITNTNWGSQGQWTPYSLLTTFNQEPTHQERFFIIILERIVKDPNLYIDLMEFMYVCISLGFKGSHYSNEFDANQLEQICSALYKRIRAHQGAFSKTLSPHPIRIAPASAKQPLKKTNTSLIILGTAGIITALFMGLGYLLDTVSNQAYQELIHIGKSILYERHDT